MSLKTGFGCFGVERFEVGEGEIIETAKLALMSPRQGDVSINHQKYEPYGSLTIAVTNPDLLGFFVVGKEYRINIERVEG